MIKIDNKVYLNIQEQVQKNKDDIAAWSNIQFTLNNFGITVLGIASGDPNVESNLPEQHPDSFEAGNAYLVETASSTIEDPEYDIWIYTMIYNASGEFINMGVLNAVGPQGPAGTVSIGTVTTGAAGSSATVTNSGSPSSAVLNFTIPKGDTGATGNGIQSIAKTDSVENVDTYTISYTNGDSYTFNIANGLDGQNGATGDPGESFMIMGTVANTSLLPNASTTPRNHAYIYSDGVNTTPDRLYYIVGDQGNESWDSSSFAAAGTTVTTDGSPVYTFETTTKQDTLPTTSTAGQVLTSTSTSGTVQWAAPGATVNTVTYQSVNDAIDWLNTNFNSKVVLSIRYKPSSDVSVSGYYTSHKAASPYHALNTNTEQLFSTYFEYIGQPSIFLKQNTAQDGRIGIIFTGGRSNPIFVDLFKGINNTYYYRVSLSANYQNGTTASSTFAVTDATINSLPGTWTIKYM